MNNLNIEETVNTRDDGNNNNNRPMATPTTNVIL
jgi:hypothetical protein